MSFDGDLEHLPIVDVIQLLHATGKSGTLTVKSVKGESQLVFHNGYIVSANHVDNSVRIGQILVDMGKLSHEGLENALSLQKKEGRHGKPIVKTLIEGGWLDAESAYRGLEALIEMTIVEVLTWSRGTFSLDVNRIVVSDEYRYFPEQLEKEIQLNTQSVLMDALRIYDERKRDGTLSTEAMFGTPPQGDGEELLDDALSDTDLGLDALDELERKIPRFFSALRESGADSAAGRVQRILAGVPAEERQPLLHYLEKLEGEAAGKEGGSRVILISGDELLRECLAALCGPRLILAADHAAEAEPILGRAPAGGEVTLLLDAGEPGSRGGSSEETVAALRRKYPGLFMLLLSCPGDYALNLAALESGVDRVLPRSSREERPESFVSDTIDCLEVLKRHLEKEQEAPGDELLRQVSRQVRSIGETREPPEATFQLLQSVGAFFPRVVTLVLVRSELIAERGIGISGEGGTSSLKLRIPVSEPSLFQRALAGESYCGEADAAVAGTLFDAIGAPADPRILILPVRSFGRVIALIYGDFGGGSFGACRPEILEILALHAGLAIDNALYRKRCAQSPPAAKGN